MSDFDQSEQSVWDSFLGNRNIIEQFQRAAANRRIGGSYLFVGPDGVGKKTFAFLLAQCLLCESSSAEDLTACGTCPGCQQVIARSHPDLDYVCKPKDKATFPLDILIGDKEVRMQEGLCHRISLKPFSGGRKVAIIDDADTFRHEAANCLLKTLEEPPKNSVIILLGSSDQKQLPTIRSRCQTIRFGPLEQEHIKLLLRNSELDIEESFLDQLSALSEGSLERAMLLSDPSMANVREMIFMQLAKGNTFETEFAKEIIGFVEAAGKDAALKRDRIRLCADWAISYFRNLINRSVNADHPIEETTLSDAVDAGLANWNRANPPEKTELMGDCLERCVDVYAHVAANANQATLIECWLSDLGNIFRGKTQAI